MQQNSPLKWDKILSLIRCRERFKPYCWRYVVVLKTKLMSEIKPQHVAEPANTVEWEPATWKDE